MRSLSQSRASVGISAIALTGALACWSLDPAASRAQDLAAPLGAPAQGGEAEPQPEAIREVLKRLRDGDFEGAERMALEERIGLLGRASEARSQRHLSLLALLARGAALQSRAPEPGAAKAGLGERWLGEAAVIASRIEVVDVPLLLQLRREAPLSVRAQVKSWLATGRERARSYQDLPGFLRAMSVPDEVVRRSATAGLARHLASQRMQVERGGRLELPARQLFQSRVLHEALISQLEREPSAAALDSLPPLELALQSESARALHALAIIGEPCRLSLEAASLAGLRRASLALEAVQKEAQRRALAFPGASWADSKPESKPNPEVEDRSGSRSEK